MTAPAIFSVSPFDSIRREDDCGEFWSARDLMPMLGYASWDRVSDVIERAMLAVNNSGMQAPDHIRGASKMIELGKGARRSVIDYHLTRFGAYMVAMNGDVRKHAVAEAQTYFAVKTREAETATPLPVIDPHNVDHFALVLQAGQAALAALRDSEAKVAELEPAAEAWDALAAEGDDFSIREAAQVLSRDDSITIGQNRLFGYLREVRWIDAKNAPYQTQVDNGRLVRRVADWTDDYGQRFVKIQPRVTAKGLAELRKRLGPAGGLALVPGGLS